MTSTDRACWLIASSIAAVACGARSDITLSDGTGEPGSGGAGASGPSGASSSRSATSTAATSASTGGAAVTCEAFVLDGPPIPLPQGARAPQLAVEGQAMRVAWHFGRFVYSQRLEPATRWPEPFADLEEHAHIGDDGTFVMAPASITPVFLQTEEGTLMLNGAGGQIDPMPAASPGLDPHFVARNGDTYLYASANGPFFDAGSYITDSLPQTQEPHVCLSTAARAAGVAHGDHFLVAFIDATPQGTSCFSMLPLIPHVLVLTRYDLPGTPQLPSTMTLFQQEVEPILHLGLASTPTGAWLVFQTDGSTSPVVPPIRAIRTNDLGIPVSEIPVTAGGVVTSDLVATSLDEALVLARVDHDQAVTSIRVQRVEADGRASASLEIPTLVLFERTLNALATPDQRSVLLTWERADGQAELAKLDCVR